MGIWGKIFSSGATELVKEVGSVVDDLVTTEEEKIEEKRKLKNIIMNYESELQKEVTTRWTQDMNSDSWLSKNIRPMVLIFLVVSTVVLIFIDGGVIDFHVDSNWINLLQLTLLTVISAYFGGRSWEKIKRN